MRAVDESPSYVCDRLYVHLSLTFDLPTAMSEQTFDIPKECWAGGQCPSCLIAHSNTREADQVAVVKNEGPDFYVEVEKVPVPEIGTWTKDELRPASPT